jgi:cytochrome c biogenesis protein
MAITEVQVKAKPASTAEAGAKAKPRKKESALDKVLSLLSSVRFGVTMLMILLACCMIGMLVMQQDVEGFQQYYARLTPSQKLVYGKLGFFNIYHSWYFSLLLAITGLNIVLASIDRFPIAWQYIRKPKLTASPNFIRAQMFVREVEVEQPAEVFAEKVCSVWRKLGMRARITKERGRITVFGQRHVWNRLGAYFVHLALLTIFFGGFLTNRYGVGGMMEIIPGRSSDTFNTLKVELDGQRINTVKLPFVVECEDIQQLLIRPEGGLDPSNTIDWLSHIKIRDGEREVPALVHLNQPFDYRGYRFFQSSFLALGYARQITISLVPVSGGQPRQLTIGRNRTVDVEGIGRISYVNFYPDFTIENGKPTTASGDYNNPVAQLQVETADGKIKTVFAFNPVLADQFYTGTERAIEEALLLDGNKVILNDFEKVATSHTLQVQYDPGRKPVYVGFVLLVICLCGVFFFAHQRVWAVVEPFGGGAKVYFGGNTNRNRSGFESRFNQLVASAIEGREVKK